MSKQPRSGFTLVELLVVIGIIALLISILLPSLTKVRESANTVKCLANLKSIGQAANIYSSENQGILLPAGYLDLSAISGNGGQIVESYATILVYAGYLTAPIATTATQAPMTGPSVFFCPNALTDSIGVYFASAAGGTVKPVMTTRTDGLGARPWRAGMVSTANPTTTGALNPGVLIDTWYGINAGWGANLNTNPFPALVQPDTSVSTGAYTYRKAGVIPHAADMVFMFDGTFYDLNYDANRINARHNRQTSSNLLFVDGHAGTFAVKDLPGGAGNANSVSGSLGSTIFDTPNLKALEVFGSPKWRIDEP